jgi:hypothetical protein
VQNRTPVARAARPALPAFTPVPRKYRHDGWTPERQIAFIEALADTGSVTRAAGMVNMAQTNCYALRRAPGADEFRRAWDAALDFGVQRLKDIAFERAIEGQLIPVFVAGKLMGFRRKHNDRLLMFILRHYGQDAGGKRTTVNYFSAKATAGVATAGAVSAGDGAGAAAEAEIGTTTVRTVITGDGGEGEALALRDDRLAGTLNGFAGVTLDPEAEAAINAALEACAARARAADAAMGAGGEAAADAMEDDAAEPFVRVAETGDPYRGSLEPPGLVEDFAPFVAGEPDWRLAGDYDPRVAIEAAVASVKRARRKSGWGKGSAGQHRLDEQDDGDGDDGAQHGESPAAEIVTKT